MKKKDEKKFCETCGHPLQNDHENRATKGLILEDEEALIEHVKEKAVKATMAAILPLLEKLQEAATQQSQEMGHSADNSNEQQLKQMHELAQEKLKMRELRLQDKMKSLKAKIAMRK